MGTVEDPTVGAGLMYMVCRGYLLMSAVQFYKPGHMRWFVVIGSTQQHLYRATFTSLEYGGELGVWFVEKTGKFRLRLLVGDSNKNQNYAKF